MNEYEKSREEASKNPESFWGDIAEDCFWYKKWDKVLDDSNKPFYRWFEGGVTNTCYNAVDLHVEKGFGEQPALIYDSPVTGVKKQYSFLELRDKVALFAGTLADLGVLKGDRVII
jgi:propionyl-CoA synthetase